MFILANCKFSGGAVAIKVDLLVPDGVSRPACDAAWFTSSGLVWSVNIN